MQTEKLKKAKRKCINFIKLEKIILELLIKEGDNIVFSFFYSYYYGFIFNNTYK